MCSLVSPMACTRLPYCTLPLSPISLSQKYAPSKAAPTVGVLRTPSHSAEPAKTKLTRPSRWSHVSSCRKAGGQVSHRRRAQMLAAAAGTGWPAVAHIDAELPAGATEEDAMYMRRAVELARRALGKTSPNPMVGCVIVKDGQIIGEGFHPKAGEPHAEVFALREAGSAAAGATAYVSLEPCDHFGRTPPCSQALVRARVKRVVVGATDPNPLVGGRGIETLRRAGVEVVVGVEEERCRRNVEAFMCRITEKRPFATLRYTMSLDGKAVGNIGSSGVQEGSYYSRLLAENDAVVVTHDVLGTNPLLLSAEPEAGQPLRVILASSLDLNRSASVFDTSLAPTLVITDEKALTVDVERSSSTGEPQSETWLRERGVEFVVVDEIDFDNVLDMCYQRNVSSVLWDSQAPEGSNVDASLGRRAIDEGLVDKIVTVVSPVLIGGHQSGIAFELGESVQKLERISTHMSGQDVIIEGYPVKS